MELTYILVAVLIIALPVVLTKILSGKSRDAKTVLGAVPDAKPVAMERERLAAVQPAPRTLAAESKARPGALPRRKPGVPLEEGKDVVAATTGKEIETTRLAPGLRETIRHAQEIGEEVQRLVKKGRKVEAIKLIREQSGMGLKEAKTLVDRLG